MRKASISALVALLAASAVLILEVQVTSQGVITRAQDPGIRTGAATAGGPLPGLTAQELEYFQAGSDDFLEADNVAEGLGPRMNMDSCGSCHAQPALGGSSPALNPQFAFATKDGGTDTPPSFILADGPVREVRFVRNADGTPDGGVHALFTITGRIGAGACRIRQPDFAAQLAARNVIFRIPTPVFGLGLVEQIADSAIVANQAANSGAKRTLGIGGRANFNLAGRTISGQSNHNGNDGTIARLGWKAQNKSLLLFSGEAYNVEMGITNDLFPTERDENNACQSADLPNSVTDLEATEPVDSMASIEKFAHFMRFLAPPMPSPDQPGGATSIERGRAAFTSIGCSLCHTPTLMTGPSRIPALANQEVNLFSDLLLHDMGTGLADGISQGEAGPQEFRTAPLWGLGQRIFLLHDGRTTDLLAAIRAHQSTSSEANQVITRFGALGETLKQDMLNFLRSL